MIISYTQPSYLFFAKKYIVFVSTYSSESILRMILPKWHNVDIYNGCNKNNWGNFYFFETVWKMIANEM